MKNLVFLILAMVSSEVSAQEVTVNSLYEASSRLPGALIPLVIGGPVIQEGGKVSAVSVTAENAADCRVMRDPFLPRIYLLKCQSESVVRIHFDVIQGEQMYKVVYGPITVEIPEDGMEIIPPEIPTEPRILVGQQLFNAYCIACHTQPAEKAGRSQAQIQNAVSNISVMRSLSTSLKDEDYKNLEAYLKSL